MKTQLYTYTGAAKGEMELSNRVFGEKLNADLLHQVIVSYQSNARAGTAHTKFRSEVSGGGKKPWKQKGTGKARHGSSRSPIWTHGGVSHGPRSTTDFTKKVNDKMKLKALAIVLSGKLTDGTLLFVEGSPEYTKTKMATDSLVSLSTKVAGFSTLLTKTNPNNILVCVGESVSESAIKALRNIPCVSVVSASRLNVLQASKARYIVIADATSAHTLLDSRMMRISKKTI